MPQDFPNVQHGTQTVVRVNDVHVSNRSELRELLSEIAQQGGGLNAKVQLSFSEAEVKQVALSAEILAKLAGGPKVYPKEGKPPAPPGGDDFDDLESCGSDEAAAENVMNKLQRRGNTSQSQGGASSGAKAEPAIDDSFEDDPNRVMANAAQKVEPGNCIIILTQGLNPAMYVESAAKDNGVSVMYVSGGQRLKNKVRLDDFEAIIAKALRSPVWILIESATKSISSLQELANAIKEVRSTDSFHPKTRIFLMCEPHPHFPEELLKGSITLRFRPNPGAHLRQLEETMHDSRSKIDIMTGIKTSAKKNDDLAVSFKPERRRVQIASDVDVVLLESSTVNASEDIPHGKEKLDPKETGLRLDAQHTACRGGESLISLSKISENRFAVGNNAGQVLILDLNALPMMQFRPLKACIWDMAFASNYDFAAACEDGTASIMEYDMRRREIITKASAKFESDVFAITYAGATPDSAVVSGGLSNAICVLHSDRQQASRCVTTTSIQAITMTHAGSVLFGGGSGLTGIVDPETTTIIRSANKHTKKVPAACCITNIAVTGSFDKAVRLWDMRDRFSSTHSLVMADVVTAVSIDGNEMCCCSGNSLYIWDIRNLRTVLDSRVNAWKGLTRGLQLFSDSKHIATASVDGVVRIWKY